MSTRHVQWAVKHDDHLSHYLNRAQAEWYANRHGGTVMRQTIDVSEWTEAEKGKSW